MIHENYTSSSKSSHSLYLSLIGFLNVTQGEDDDEIDVGELGSGGSGPSTDDSQGPSPAAARQVPEPRKIMSSRESKRPSLAKMVLALDSVSAQQRALQQILNTIQILSAREAIVAALLPTTIPTTGQVERDNDLGKSHWVDSDSMETSILSPSSFAFSTDGSIKEDMTGEGGGEALASQVRCYIIFCQEISSSRIF